MCTGAHVLHVFMLSLGNLFLVRVLVVQKEMPGCPPPGGRIPGQQPPRGSLLLLQVANSLGPPEHQWACGAGPWGLTVPAAHSQPPALSQLVSLYLGRSHFLWKEPATMSWLEENVHKVLQAVDAGDPAVEACESR